MTEPLPTMQILEGANSQDWDGIISCLPGPHFLQTLEWAQVKAPIGWRPRLVVWRTGEGAPSAAAMVLKRSIRLGGHVPALHVLYAPRGPLLDWEDQPLRCKVLGDLKTLARNQRALFIKIDPEVSIGWGIAGSTDDEPNQLGQAVQAELAQAGWRFSTDQIQFRNTVMIDLSAPEDVLLERMKQKTRYNIRLAEKKGVVVCQASGEDLHQLYQMYAETSVRDGFVIREESYYLRVWSQFMQAGMADPLIARVDGEAVAGVVVFRFGGRAWYVHGMSRPVHREKMPNYLLQWEAMRRARSAGCTAYDLWGAPDTWNEEDPLWRVFRFKEGLGGRVLRTPGAWDFPVSPAFYKLYTIVLPRLLDLLRRQGKTRTRNEVSSL